MTSSEALGQPHLSQPCTWTAKTSRCRVVGLCLCLEHQYFLIDGAFWQQSSPSLLGLVFYGRNYDINMYIFDQSWLHIEFSRKVSSPPMFSNFLR